MCQIEDRDLLHLLNGYIYGQIDDQRSPCELEERYYHKRWSQQVSKLHGPQHNQRYDLLISIKIYSPKKKHILNMVRILGDLKVIKLNINTSLWGFILSKVYLLFMFHLLDLSGSMAME